MRRVVCQLDEKLADRAFRLASELGISRSKLVRQALENYIEEYRQQRIAQMKVGYKQMAKTNLDLAEEALACSEADWESYEDRLLEGESG
ncbi:MAG: CopG family ribbon-helix-helix protein [Bacillota bacterium]|jgi:metal-responsive CopG/Arc/MetJ family transcriptional regulator